MNSKNGLNNGVWSTKGLREEAKLKGARTLIGEQFAHPFMDSREIRKARLKIIMQFLFDRG